MSRSLWFVAGSAAGVYGVVRARRAIETLTPDGLRDRVAGLSLGARLFTDEVRTGMVEKETELRTRLRLVGAADGVLEVESGKTVGGAGEHAAGAPLPEARDRG